MKILKDLLITLLLTFCFTNIAYSGLIEPKEKPKNLTNIATIDKKIEPKKIILEPKTIIEKKTEDKKTNKIIEKKETKKKEDIIHKKETPKEIEITNTEGIVPPEKPLDLGIKKTSSKIISEKDFKISQNIFNYIKRNNWKSAFKEAKKASNPIISKLVDWSYLIESNNNASFYDYVAFIDKNNNWPRIDRLRYLAEHKIDFKEVAPAHVINFFQSIQPFSGYGEMKYGEALLIAGKETMAKQFIKKGFIRAYLSKDDFRYISKKYKYILTQEDYIQRAEYMAWENEYWELNKTIPYLPKGYKELYFARFSLMTRSYGVDSAINKVPKDMISNVGLQYDRMKWRRKRGRYDSALEIINIYTNEPEKLVKPELWFKEKLIIARKKIDQKKYEEAYALLTNHGITDKAELADAEWHAGWLALSFLNKPDEAITHFKTMYDSVGYPISRSRGAFWLAKGYEKLGKKTEANKWYGIAATQTTTFYGQLALIKIGKQKISIRNDYTLDKEKYNKFLKTDLAKVIILLNELNETRRSKDFIKHIGGEDTKLENRIFAGTLSQKVERLDYSIQLAKQASYEGINLLELNYPVIETPHEVKGNIILDQEYILALIRQESEFDRSANSHVGAKGLMQIMPATGKLLSKQLKMSYNKDKLTEDEFYNLQLGTYYISELYKNFDNNIYLALAAYNAGPHRVTRWLKRFGDPRKKQIDTLDFIEHIPFLETRNYVQRVIENINVYKYVLNKKPVSNNIQKLLYN